ncbi:hypothetical protein ScPMuIL_010420 [Solemya velum]
MLSCSKFRSQFVTSELAESKSVDKQRNEQIALQKHSFFHKNTEILHTGCRNVTGCFYQNNLKMAPIDPRQLLNSIEPLLGVNGCIKGPCEAVRICSLMKEAVKLASRCMYVNILKATDSLDTLERFMSCGGWQTMNDWLTESKEEENIAFMVELLKVYQQLPVTVDILKENSAAKTIKQLRKSENEKVQVLSSSIVDIWMKKIKEKGSQESNDKTQKKGKRKDIKKEDSKDKNAKEHRHRHHSHGYKDKKSDLDKRRDSEEKEMEVEESRTVETHSIVRPPGNGLKLHIKIERTEKTIDADKNDKISKKLKSDRGEKSEYDKSDKDKATKKVKLEKSEKTVEPDKNDNEKTDPSVRRKATTVKTRTTKFRSTGLEEESVLVLKKKNVEDNNTKSQPKRPIPIQKQTEEPVEKRPRINIPPPLPSSAALSPTMLSPAEVHGKIKIIPPRPKPSHVLQESSGFIDSLVPSDRHVGVIKKKKKIGTIATTPSTPTMTKPLTPTSPISPNTSLAQKLPTVPSFYKETLETNEVEKDQTSRSMEERHNPSPTEEVKEENDSTEAAVEMNSSNKDTEDQNGEERDPSPTEEMDIGVNGDLGSESSNEPKGLLTTGKTSKKKTGKKVTWAEEPKLRNILYFELDETERVNVNRAKDFHAMQKQEMMMDRKAMESAKRISNDKMKETMPWRRPPHISMAASGLERGSKSTEKTVQKERESGVLSAIFFSKDMLPDGPIEPDLDSEERIEPKSIPLEDESSSGDENYYSYDEQDLPPPNPFDISAFSHMNLPLELTNFMASFQGTNQAALLTDPNNIMLASNIQNILGSMMSGNGEPGKQDQAFEKLKQMLEPFSNQMAMMGVPAPSHGMGNIPSRGPLLGVAPPGFNPQVMGPGHGGPGPGPGPGPGMGQGGPSHGGPGPGMAPPGGPGMGPRPVGHGGPGMGPGGPGMGPGGPGPGMGPSGLGGPGMGPGPGPGMGPRFPQHPSGRGRGHEDEWGENLMGGPGSMRGRGGRAGIPMRGRMPGPPNMRGRGGRGGFRPVAPDRSVCRHFRAGGCRRGNQCGFLHPGVNGPPQS